MKIVQWLYTTMWGRFVRAGITNRFFCSVVGWCAQRRFSVFVIKPFVSTYAIAVDECEKPLQAYSTFNDFFSRRLVADARPVTQGDLCVPADGMLLLYRHINQLHSLVIKKVSVDLVTLTNHSFDGSCDVVIVRLRLHDYHRFHMPCDGVVKSIRHIRGGYDSVDPVVYAVGKNPLLTNERVVITIAVQQGDMQFVCVGALVVGRIIILCKEGMSYRKGDELGYFLCGASTVVCIMPAGSVEYDREADEKEKFYKMGSLLGVYKKSA